MSYSGFSDDHQKKGNYRGKCIYLMMLLKQLNIGVWKRLQPRFQSVPTDETFGFYQTLLAEYHQLKDNGNKDMGEVVHTEEIVKTTKKIKFIDPNKAAEKKRDKVKVVKSKEHKKEDKEKDKKIAKKKVAKKTAKKKAPTKKVAKKITKKVAKKITKKVAKKTSKKTTKKTTQKKQSKKK